MTIDSHLHVWSASGPYAQDPPAVDATVETLLKTMAANDVQQALIIQPINYKFDHTVVREALRAHPRVFKGMLLADPSLGADVAGQIRGLHDDGFVGVRLNPYLWANKEGAWIDDDAGRAIFATCAELKMPVGIMAFGGLLPLAPHVRRLATEYPGATVILDHWGFVRADPAAPPSTALAIDEDAWTTLLEFAQLPNVYVKISALFRVSQTDAPHADLQPRFTALLDAYGPDRLMWGSDFPYVAMQPGGYAASIDAVRAWLPDDAVMAGTARRLFFGTLPTDVK